MPDKIITISKALHQAALSLKEAGIETSILDAQLLLCEILHVSKTALIASDPHKAINTEQYNLYHSLLERRIKGECVAYLVGHREFWGLNIKVNHATLVPRPETETLVEAALSLIPVHSKQRVLDLCTGSGAAAIAIRHERPYCTVYASDISKDALEIARENAAALCASALTIIQSDLFENISGAFDIIIANPPYIPSPLIPMLPKEVQREPHLALEGGWDGLDIIKKIVFQAQNHLAPGAYLLMEADPSQMNFIKQLLHKNNYSNTVICKDIYSRERVIIAKVKDS